MLATLAAFVGVSALVICTPGQDTALTIRNTLAGGRRSGIETAFGVAAGQAVWTLAASAGVVTVLRASEPVFHTLRLAGGAYLVYLGGRSLAQAFGRRRAARSPSRPDVQAATRHGIRQGVLSNLGNPKMAVFFASLLPQSRRVATSSGSSASGSCSAPSRSRGSRSTRAPSHGRRGCLPAAPGERSMP